MRVCPSPGYLFLSSMGISLVLVVFCFVVGAEVEKLGYYLDAPRHYGASFEALAIFIIAIPICFFIFPFVFWLWVKLRRSLPSWKFSGVSYNIFSTIIFWIVTVMFFDFQDISTYLIQSSNLMESRGAVQTLHNIINIGAASGVFALAWLAYMTLMDRVNAVLWIGLVKLGIAACTSWIKTPYRSSSYDF